MKIVRILIVTILSLLHTTCHALTDYQQCGKSKICWIDQQCTDPNFPSSMVEKSNYAFRTEAEQNCPLFFTIRPFHLKKWQIEMMDKNTTMQDGVGLKRENAGDVFLCNENQTQSGVPGIVISDESIINDTSGGVHCIFNISSETGLTPLNSFGNPSSLYYFQNTSEVDSFAFSNPKITKITPCSEDYDCAKDEVCSSPKKNNTELICGAEYEKLYKDFDGNWMALTDHVICEKGLLKINSTYLSFNAQLKCAKKMCHACTYRRPITKGSFVAASHADECAHIKCHTNKMLIDNSTLYNSNLLNCSSSHHSLWNFGKTPRKISNVECIDRVNCSLLTPVYSSCTGREFCSEANLTKETPVCAQGSLNYIDAVSTNATPLASIDCDATTGTWKLTDKEENYIAVESSILLQCISEEETTKSAATADGPPYPFIVCGAAVVLLILIIMAVVILCICKRRKAKAAGGTASVKSEAKDVNDKPESASKPLVPPADKTAPTASQDSSKAKNQDTGTSAPETPAPAAQESTAPESKDDGTTAVKPAPATTLLLRGETTNPEPSAVNNETKPAAEPVLAAPPDAPQQHAKTGKKKKSSTSSGKKKTQKKTKKEAATKMPENSVAPPPPQAHNAADAKNKKGNAYIEGGETTNPEPSAVNNETKPAAEPVLAAPPDAPQQHAKTGKKKKSSTSSGKKKNQKKTKKEAATKMPENSVAPPPPQAHNAADAKNKKGNAYIEEYARSLTADEPCGDEEAIEETALSDEEDSPNRRTSLDIAAIYEEFKRIVATKKAEIKFLRNEVDYTASQVIHICRAVIAPLNDGGWQPKVPLPCVVAGDLHGQYHDLVTIFKTMGRDEKPGHLCRRYIFMGAYVDRGPHSLEVLMMLFILKTRFPANFTLLRGNHEDCAVNELYGFAKELKDRFPDENALKEVRQAIYKAISYLPFTAIAGDCFYLAHGGISPNVYTRDEAAIPLPLHCCEVKGNTVATEITWSDPDNKPGTFFTKNQDRNDGLYFGEQGVEDFRRKFRVNKVFRGHQVVSGVQESFNGRVITVCSASGFKKGDRRPGAITYLAKSKEHDKVYTYYGPRLSDEVREKLRNQDKKKKNNKNNDEDELTVAP